ncbi:MAG: oxidoreductase [Hyphomicrobium sp.]|uniref:oxidoreductase n=1 Tax=Hyphomicrobium sp. TaxID=82 RepID=UPI0039E6FBAF
MTDSSKIWFITGISRGFGKSLAEALLADGESVIGTTRDGVPPIEDPTGKLHTLSLDVTDSAAVKTIIAEAHGFHGRLDVIVNNAGYGLLGSIEEATEDQIARMFDVNFHGTRRVVQAVLPYLRKQRFGHIVNITSIAGLAPGAGSGFYAASKFAVEGMSQSLAQEVAPLGIKVTLVEPGAFRTDFLSEHSIRTRPVGIADYVSTAGAALKALENMAGKQIGDPDRAAAAIIKAVQAQEPPLHLVLGSDAFRRTLDKQRRFATELDAWKETSLATDY